MNRHRSRAFSIAAIASAGLSFASAGVPVPTFDPQTLDAEVRIGYGVAVGRVDGDGFLDILLADAKEIRWYRNPGRPNEAWSRHVIARDLTPRDNVCIAARDIDGDGLVEIAAGRSTHNLVVYWNRTKLEGRE